MNLREVENLFLSLRMDESRGMYKSIFEAIGQAPLNLEKVRSRIVSRQVDTTVPTSKQVAGSPIEASATPTVTGEGKLDSIIEDIFNLGVTSKNTRVLTQQGVEKSVIKLRNKYPEYAKYMDDNLCQTLLRTGKMKGRQCQRKKGKNSDICHIHKRFFEKQKPIFCTKAD